MPEAIKRIVEEINANVEMDAALTAAFTAGLSAGALLAQCATEQQRTATG